MNALQRFELLRDSIYQLRQVVSSLHSESFHGLAARIDEAILKLEVIEREEIISPGRIDEVLKVLGQGLATVPTIVRLLEFFRSQ
jgi:hypothetical protein